jgi:hypothetical protein
MPAGSVVDGLEVPYQPWAAARKIENFTNRASADPLAQCYLPGAPRIMYMEWRLGRRSLGSRASCSKSRAAKVIATCRSSSTSATSNARS